MQLLQVLSDAVIELMKKPNKRPLLVGIQGVQGIGKSFTTAKLRESLCEQGFKTVVLSIDDFYNTHDKLQQLSRESKNPLWEQRGLPGTHDVELMENLLHRILTINEGDVQVPTYRKEAHSGQGDRGQSQTISLPADVVILEGWMVGFMAQADDCVGDTFSKLGYNETTVQNAKQVNEELRRYELVFSMLDMLIALRADTLQNVYQWRLEQERDLIHRTGKGMSSSEIKEFVDRFMICYGIYLQPLYQQANIVITLNRDRQITNIRRQSKD
ncbi:hypothetical protein MIR68_002945 [Amoeboaphelidium protococcarum]|nr:hypothetical protein MIR68_002945 [Amoeboaphelidium protococcarum]